ncbi:hypothetical protein ON010_g14330 [Phytophthora cinnamomi]|nr:hypothetical protein ON010_g14330 [Phytophthora cinnamomi]
MRLPATATPGMDAHPNQQKRPVLQPRRYGGGTLRRAAEYGLGLLEANEELQMQVATLKIQLETETEELSVERDMWQRRSDHALQEVAQWKRKFARVEEEKTDLAEEFEQFVDRCECRAPDTTTADAATSIPASVTSSGRRRQKRSNEAELTSLRQWKEVAEQQQQEALECEVLAAQSEVSYRKKMEEERAATQRAMNELKREKDQLRKAAHKHEEEMRALKKQLRIAEETRDDAQLHSNELSEEILSSESRCKRLQRELELLEHVSYFSQAIVDRDDEESDEDDEVVVEESNLETLVVSEKPEVKNIAANVDGSENDTETPAMPSPLRIKRRRSFLVATATPYSPFPTTTVSEDGTRVQASESEMETHKKLHHYFHLTALSIIHENNLLERCFNSSSRLTIDMWYREIIAKEVPFLTWHSWLINRISEVAASVQDDDEVPQPPTSTSKASSFSGAFHGFSMRKTSACSDATPPKNMLPSPPTVSSSPVSSPVARVPFTVARAFFRLLRKNTHAGSGSTSVGGSPAVTGTAHPNGSIHNAKYSDDELGILPLGCCRENGTMISRAKFLSTETLGHASTIDDDAFLVEVLEILNRFDPESPLPAIVDGESRSGEGDLLRAVIQDQEDNQHSTSTTPRVTIQGQDEESSARYTDNPNEHGPAVASSTEKQTRGNRRGRMYMREKLIQLRSVVQKMESYLETLRSPRLGGFAGIRAELSTMDEYKSSEINVHASEAKVWRTIAMDQFHARRMAEQQNAQLREALATQVRLSKQLKTLLESQQPHQDTLGGGS